jgi:general secretion pathway protein J
MTSRGQERQSGFTLLEMLVALSLLGLLTAFALMSLSGLSHIKRIEERVEGRSDAEAARLHLRNTMSDIRPVFMLAKDAEARLAFSGNANTIAFVSVMSDQVELGGLYWIKYSLKNSDLVLTYHVFRPDVQMTDGKQHVLVTDVASLSFRYLDVQAEDTEGQWSDTWSKRVVLPKAIEIKVEFKTGTERQPIVEVINPQ